MKRILIIGATSAIASACARRWAADKASLFLVGRDLERLTALTDDLYARGAYDVQSYQMDINETSAHLAMIAAANNALGSLDITLIAHGTLPDQTACEKSLELTTQEFVTNGLSVITLLTVLANQLELQAGGNVGVITSVAGDRGRPSNYVYGSAKAAVSTFCEGLRVRLHRSNASLTEIRPGYVATPMTEGLELPDLLVAEPDTVASRLIAAIETRKNVVYAPAYWAIIMLVIRNIPRFAFKRMGL